MQCYVSLHASTKSSFAMSVNISAQNEIRPKILDARLVSEVRSHAVIQSRHIQTERVLPPTRGKLEKKADYVSMKRPSERKTTSGIIPVCDLMLRLRMYKVTMLCFQSEAGSGFAKGRGGAVTDSCS